MVKSINKFSLVLVEWIDSYGVGQNWDSILDLKPKHCLCFSAGYLVHHDKDHVVIVPHLETMSHAGCGDMTIPVKAIRAIRKLNAGNRIKL